MWPPRGLHHLHCKLSQQCNQPLLPRRCLFDVHASILPLFYKAWSAHCVQASECTATDQPTAGGNYGMSDICKLTSANYSGTAVVWRPGGRDQGLLSHKHQSPHPPPPPPTHTHGHTDCTFKWHHSGHQAWSHRRYISLSLTHTHCTIISCVLVVWLPGQHGACKRSVEVAAVVLGACTRRGER